MNATEKMSILPSLTQIVKKVLNLLLGNLDGAIKDYSYF